MSVRIPKIDRAHDRMGDWPQYFYSTRFQARLHVEQILFAGYHECNMVKPIRYVISEYAALTVENVEERDVGSIFQAQKKCGSTARIRRCWGCGRDLLLGQAADRGCPRRSCVSLPHLRSDSRNDEGARSKEHWGSAGRQSDVA